MPKLYIETYGCQMNVADSEVVAAILQKQDYHIAGNPEEADLVLVNTCSIRDNAEKRVKARLEKLTKIPDKKRKRIIGVIGCMAERLKEDLIEELPTVDLIAGPDSYRNLPSLLKKVTEGNKGINTMLSLEETYSEINPVRLDEKKVTAFISIMRGCDNFCSYCVVPYTRGRERSRDPETICSEMNELAEMGYREVTLLGQNVNSYSWNNINPKAVSDFPDLLRIIALEHPDIRIRFATSHPKDFSEKLIATIFNHHNICDHIHLPVQSGSDRILQRMNRKYTSTEYMGKIHSIREKIPQVSISTDIISGFCGETENDHQNTLQLMRSAAFDFAYMFKYSERPGTRAADFIDDVPEKVKTRRLNEIIELQNKLSLQSKKEDKGKIYEVLVEGVSKKSSEQLFGRTSTNKVVVFPRRKYMPGDYVYVRITNCTSATLIGEDTSLPEESNFS